MSKEKEIRATREEKLAALRQKREDMQTELKTLDNRRSNLKKKITSIGQAIYDLLHESSTVPSVTDHAVVRYLERVKGVDIQELKAEVANHSQAVRHDNTIVTVNEKLEETE